MEEMPKYSLVYSETGREMIFVVLVYRLRLFGDWCHAQDMRLARRIFCLGSECPRAPGATGCHIYGGGIILSG